MGGNGARAMDGDSLPACVRSAPRAADVHIAGPPLRRTLLGVRPDGARVWYYDAPGMDGEGRRRLIEAITGGA